MEEQLRSLTPKAVSVLRAPLEPQGTKLKFVNRTAQPIPRRPKSKTILDRLSTSNFVLGDDTESNRSPDSGKSEQLSKEIQAYQIASFSAVEQERNALKAEVNRLREQMTDKKIGDLQLEIANLKSQLAAAEMRHGQVTAQLERDHHALKIELNIQTEAKLQLLQEFNALRIERAELATRYSEVNKERNRLLETLNARPVETEEEKLKAKKAAVEHAAKILLLDRRYEPAIRKQAIAIYYSRHRDEMERILKEDLTKEYRQLLEQGALKNLLEKYPEAARLIDSQMITLLKTDLQTKARIENRARTEAKAEIKEEILQQRVEEILAIEREETRRQHEAETAKRVEIELARIRSEETRWEDAQRRIRDLEEEQDRRRQNYNKVWRDLRQATLRNDELREQVDELKSRRTRKRSRSRSRGRSRSRSPKIYRHE